MAKHGIIYNTSRVRNIEYVGKKSEKTMKYSRTSFYETHLIYGIIDIKIGKTQLTNQKGQFQLTDNLTAAMGRLGYGIET